MPDTVNAKSSIQKYQPRQRTHGIANASSATPTDRTVRVFLIQWSVELGAATWQSPDTSRKLASTAM
jgi:hypothetical protein